MFEVFKEYFDTKLTNLQKKVLASSEKYAIIYQESSWSDTPIELHLPIEPTLKPENYALEFNRINDITKNDSTVNAMSLLMYTANYLIANNKETMSKETYEQILEKYTNYCVGCLELHAYIFPWTQLRSYYDTSVQIIKNYSRIKDYKNILLKLFLLNSVDEKLDLFDLDLTKLVSIFISEEDMIKMIEEDPSKFKTFEKFYTDTDYTYKHSDMQVYADRIKRLRRNLFDQNIVSPGCRDSILLATYNTDVHDLKRFIEYAMTLDMNFGKLIGPIVKNICSHSSPRRLVCKLNDEILETLKRGSRWTALCEYSLDGMEKPRDLSLFKLEANTTDDDKLSEYASQHSNEYRYHQAIREMVYTARCCALREIPKSGIKAYGNIGSIIKLYNFNWEAIWNACWENKQLW